jgi:polar amino acid transport system substrate-binding protein
MTGIYRRDVLVGLAVAVASSFALPAAAQNPAGQGLLKKLQAAKKVRVGIANQPPFSALNPDGTLTGAAPAISGAIMKRLGIEAMEGFVANYGELIPGMMAGRWDFVSASLTITKARCAQVLYADPLILDGSALFYKKSAPEAPKSVADVVKLGVPLGTQSGGADFRTVLADGVQMANIRQFESDQQIIDGLLADRMPYALTAYSALRHVLEQRNISDLTIVYPVPDDPPKGSSCAFRQVDTDLHSAYQAELRAMKASGEFAGIMKQYGYETSPELLRITTEEACARAL